MASRLTSLQLGTTIASLAAGIILGVTGDSYFEGTLNATTASGTTLTAGGGTFKATNLADAACHKSVNGRYYDCYQEVAFTNTGACVAGGCASKAYHVFSITKPFTGSGVIKRFDVTCDNIGNATTLYAAQVTAASTASGNNVLTRKTIGSGAVTLYSTGSLVWNEATPALRGYAGTRVGVNECLAAVWSDQVYNP